MNISEGNYFQICLFPTALNSQVGENGGVGQQGLKTCKLSIFLTVQKRLACLQRLLPYPNDSQLADCIPMGLRVDVAMSRPKARGEAESSTE